MPSISEQILANADALPQAPVAFEALWDGDSDGWYVVLSAILKSEDGYRAQGVGALQDGGDMRLFNGRVPPWGEALLAQQLGEELARKFDVSFYFPSPIHPEEDCPRWWERDQGYPCRQCGILLLQRPDSRWRGVCYYCHLAEEREKKEAAWTPEERAGPRCHICGNPATAMMESWPTCVRCSEGYVYSPCTHCGVKSRIKETDRVTYICYHCDMRERLNAVPEEHRLAIRAATVEGGKLRGLKKAKELLGWGLHDALQAVQAFRAEPDGR